MTKRTKGEQRAYFEGYQMCAECVEEYLTDKGKKVLMGLLSAVKNAVDIEDENADAFETIKINCKTTKCENCQNHNYCDYEPQERAKALLEWGATPPDVLDDFVDYLIKANCNGCDLCDPRLGAEWKPNFACCEEGRAKWFLAMKDEFRESRKEQK